MSGTGTLTDSRLRIGFDLRRINRTGIGRYARNILRAVACEEPENELTVVVNHLDDVVIAQALAPRARTIVAPARQYSLREVIRPPALGVPLDVWHSPHPYQLGIGYRHPTVLTLLDLIQVDHAIGLTNVLAREPLRALIRTACRRGTRFVAISNETRELFHRRMGVPYDKMHLTPLAPDHAFELGVDPAAAAATRARWALSGRVILYVGMTQAHKNLDRLLQAVALLVRSDPGEHLQLALVGPVVPSDRARLAARIDALGLRSRVVFLGWLSDEDLRVAYHLADVVALPSIAEGFGLTLLEAMRCGAPCVASSLAVLREVAGDAALFVDPMSPDSIASGLRAVMRDKQLADTLKSRGQANVLRFSWRNAARGTLVAYRAAAGHYDSIAR